MPSPEHNLAIDTSSRQGSVALGRGDQLLEALDLPEQRRHAVELLPVVDDLLNRHRLTPQSIGELYISVGPGSFTGLRVSITTAKLLARVTGCRLVAVPTLDVIARNAPDSAPGMTRHIAVCLNAKRGQCFTGLFDRDADRGLVPRIEPSLLRPDEMLALAPRPLLVIADMPGDHAPAPDVELADAKLAIPRARVVWQLGRQLAAQGKFVDPVQLVPLYVRLPEAEEVWQAKQKATQGRSDEATQG
jgi:tRNA threonylcarbamoyladenosine biosynthesis protein TsaB